MSESFLKPFEYLYEETDKVIKKGFKLPLVNIWGKTDDIPEQVPAFPVINPIVITKPVIITTPKVNDNSTTATTSVTQPEPVVNTVSTDTPSKKGKNVTITVDDAVKATDK